MIILDTNVISELMREKPNPVVLRWIERQDISNLTITAITVGVILRGITRFPEVNRRQRLKQNFSRFVHEAFRGRILVFDEASALSLPSTQAAADSRV